MTAGWIMRMTVYKNVGLMIKTPLNRPIMVFSTLAVLSTTLGMLYGTVNPLAGIFFVAKYIEYFFLFSIVVNYVRDRAEVNRLLTLLLFVSGIIAVYGIRQALSGGDMSAPFGHAGEKNTLGGYLVLMASVAAGVLMYSDSKRERILLLPVLGLLVTVILRSLSRSSWFAIIVVAVAFLLLSKRRLMVLGVVAIGLAVLPFVVPEAVVKRFQYTFTQERSFTSQQLVVGGLRLDTSLSARFYDYLRALKGFPEHPVLGYGVTGFMFLDGQFFRILTEMGVAGLAAFLWLLASLHRLIRIAKKADLPPRLHGMIVGFQAGFWGIIAHALSANSFIIVRIAEPFWCLAALTVVCASGESFLRDLSAQAHGDTPPAEPAMPPAAGNKYFPIR
jgi:O-antigen ligase